jgi:hypothetical protein
VGGDGHSSDARSLETLGLTPGEQVRIRREADGSVAVRDADGAWRSIVIDRLEARRRGRQGPRSWEPLAERTTRSAQLTLWS